MPSDLIPLPNAPTAPPRALTFPCPSAPYAPPSPGPWTAAIDAPTPCGAVLILDVDDLPVAWVTDAAGHTHEETPPAGRSALHIAANARLLVEAREAMMILAALVGVERTLTARAMIARREPDAGLMRVAERAREMLERAFPGRGTI